MNENFLNKEQELGNNIQEGHRTLNRADIK